MFEQALIGGGRGENPVVLLKEAVARSESLGEAAVQTTFDKHFLGSEVRQQFIDRFGCSFGRQELAGRDVQKRNAAEAFSKVHGGKEIILAMV